MAVNNFSALKVFGDSFGEATFNNYVSKDNLVEVLIDDKKTFFTPRNEDFKKMFNAGRFKEFDKLQLNNVLVKGVEFSGTGKVRGFEAEVYPKGATDIKDYVPEKLKEEDYDCRLVTGKDNTFVAKLTFGNKLRKNNLLLLNVEKIEKRNDRGELERDENGDTIITNYRLRLKDVRGGAKNEDLVYVIITPDVYEEYRYELEPNTHIAIKDVTVTYSSIGGVDWVIRAGDIEIVSDAKVVNTPTQAVNNKQTDKK